MVNLKYSREHISKKKDLDQAAIETYAKEYKDFLNVSKTEREAVKFAASLAESKGFHPFNFESNVSFGGGDKYYYISNNKSIVLFNIGYENINNGMNIIAAHIDSPRLDLKQMPLHESNDIAYFRTHYYGGIKKYQWATIPLALHGVIYTVDNKKIYITIGEDENDPILYISDLLPHLAEDQLQKTGEEIINAEQLNVIVGSRINSTQTKDENNKDIDPSVKQSILEWLFEKYNIDESSFISAELEIVPALKARDAALDRSLIAAYGQDDRVCAFAALWAFIDCANIDCSRTSVCVLTDKEEIGSVGNTGLRSNYLTYILQTIVKQRNGDFGKTMLNSYCISADVNAAFDPMFLDVFESQNATYLNNGIAISKYTGCRGKSGASDANAEYVHKIIQLFNEGNISWQMGELGKVDAGGGGTVAAYLANLGINVIDIGVPVLSMHAPYEITSKYDNYMAFIAFALFFLKI